MSAVRPPCKSCPWIVANAAERIPNFVMALAEGLSACQSGELDAPAFACHLSRPGEEFPCAGWLAAHGREHVRTRLAVALGQVPIEALDPQPGWPELHDNYDAMMAKLTHSP
jgi:hypothetical protein